MARESIDKSDLMPTDELSQLKREMAEKVIEEYNKSQGGLLNDLFKDEIVDYVVDEGDFLFEFALKVGFLKKSAKGLEALKERIKTTNEKDELSSLENEVMNNIKNKGVFIEVSSENTGNTTPATSSDEVSSNGMVYGNVSGNGTDYDAIQEIDYNTPHLQSVPLGQAREVPLNRRMEWLFPSGVPSTEKEMLKYITKIKVPIYTPDGKRKEISLNIHKKLANEYQAIFQEMFDKKIPVNPSTTGGYNWRKMRRGKKLSHHSYGSAVDVNWDVNGGVYGKTLASSPYYNNKQTVDIWKKHGFYRGGDRSKKSYDPMHFTYMNG